MVLHVSRRGAFPASGWSTDTVRDRGGRCARKTKNIAGRRVSRLKERGRPMDERLQLLVTDFKAGRYTRRQFVRKVLGLGMTAAALPAVFEMAGETFKQPSALPAAEAAAGRGTVVVGIPENITNPDPVILASAGYGDIKAVNNNINEPIIRFKTGSVDLEPCLASSWDISDDGLVYTFHLRPALFQDGTPVT